MKCIMYKNIGEVRKYKKSINIAKGTTDPGVDCFNQILTVIVDREILVKLQLCLVLQRVENTCNNFEKIHLTT